MTTKSKGIVGSIVVHIVIIVLLILFGFSTSLPLPDEEGILINFGTDDVGRGAIEPRPADPVTSTPPPVERMEHEETPVLTQDFEDAPSIPTPQPRRKPDPVPERRPEPDPQPTVVEQVKPQEEKPREPNQMALFPGRRPDGDTSGEGDGSRDGNQGDPSGSPYSTAREGGTGGDGISFSLGGRASLSLPRPEYPSQKSGRVVVQVTVDRQGNVTQATPGVRGSTTLDTELLSAAEKAALRAKFDVSPSAPAFQTGTITYVFRLQQ